MSKSPKMPDAVFAVGAIAGKVCLVIHCEGGPFAFKLPPDVSRCLADKLLHWTLALETQPKAPPHALAPPQTE